jgi:hypothetical protein
VGGGSAATGTGGASALNEVTAQWVMERLPGRWSNAAQIEEMPTLRPKDLSVCALEAPALGDRVLYVERSDPSAPDQPDVQIILDIEAISLEYNEAVAKVYVPEQAEVWVGLCDGATSRPAPPSELRGLGEDCDRGIAYNDGSGKSHMSVSGAVACVPHAPAGAVLARSRMAFDDWTLSAHDEFELEGGELLERDPPGELDLAQALRNRRSPGSK